MVLGLDSRQSAIHSRATSLATISFEGVQDSDVTFSWPGGGNSTKEKPKEAIYTKETTVKKVDVSGEGSLNDFHFYQEISYIFLCLDGTMLLKEFPHSFRRFNIFYVAHLFYPLKHSVVHYVEKFFVIFVW